MADTPDGKDWRDMSEADPAMIPVARSIVPVYAHPNAALPIHVGSAVLATIAGRKVLLTAAHVLKNVEQGGELAIASSGKLKRLRNVALVEEGHADVAIIPVTDRNAPAFGDSPFLAVDQIGDVDMNDGVDFKNVLAFTYTLMGFVKARSFAKYKPAAKQFHNKSLNANLTLAFLSQYTADEIPDLHVLLDYDKVLKMNGAWSTGPDPHGASGGAVFRFARNGPPDTKLVAIPHTYPNGRNVIRCTRMSYIRMLVERAVDRYPDWFA